MKMNMVSVNPELRAFSYYGTGAAEVSEVSEDDKLGAGPIIGYVVGAVGLLSLMMACVLASQKPAPIVIDANLSSEDGPVKEHNVA